MTFRPLGPDIVDVRGQKIQPLAFARTRARTQKIVGRVALGFLAPGIRFDGADISHHQDDAGPIDWPLLRSISWWIATKCSQGSAYVDPTYAEHRRQMRAQAFDIKLYYHWLSPNVSATVQAVHFLIAIGKLEPGEGVMLDVEQAGVTAAMVLEWCEQVERVTGRPCVIYTGAYVAGGTIWQSTAVRNSLYGPRPMHLAAYTTEARARSLPGVATYPWSGWQYSSDGPVAGVTGRCDMNRIDVRTHYDLACGITVAPPTPTPTPTPPSPPTPSPGDDDVLRLLAPIDSPARFYAMCDSAGRALRCEWTGSGLDPKVLARIDFYRNAHPAGTTFEMALSVGDLVNVSLDGPLPPGFTAAQFGNPDEINSRSSSVIDQTARAQADNALAVASAASSQAATAAASAAQASGDAAIAVSRIGKLVAWLRTASVD